MPAFSNGRPYRPAPSWLVMHRNMEAGEILLVARIVSDWYHPSCFGLGHAHPGHLKSAFFDQNPANLPEQFGFFPDSNNRLARVAQHAIQAVQLADPFLGQTALRYVLGDHLQAGRSSALVPQKTSPDPDSEAFSVLALPFDLRFNHVTVARRPLGQTRQQFRIERDAANHTVPDQLFRRSIS